MKRILLISAALCSFLPTIGMETRAWKKETAKFYNSRKKIMDERLSDAVYNKKMPFVIRKELERDPKSPLVALLLVGSPTTPCHNFLPANAKKKIWRYMGVNDETKVENRPVKHLLIQFSETAQIARMMKIDEETAGGLKNRDREILSFVAEGYDRANCRIIPVTEEQFQRIRQLPLNVRQNCVYPQKDQGDLPFSVYVPATFTSNVANVARGAATGAAIGAFAGGAFEFIKHGAEDMASTAATVTIGAVKAIAIPLVTDKATTYVQHIVFDQDALNGIKTKVIMEKIENGPYDLLENPCAMDAIAGKTGYEYAQHVKASLGDKERGYAYFQENVQKPLIETAQETFSDSIKDQLLNPSSYNTANLTQKQFVKPVLISAGVGGLIGFGWGLGQWNTPLEEAVEIRHINKFGRKDTLYAPLRSISGKQNEE